MSFIDDLKAERADGHPDTGAYSEDDKTFVVEINAVNRTVNKDTMTSSQVYNAIVASEYTALTTSQQDEIWNILHLGEINPFGLEATRFTAIFGVGSATITALAAARQVFVSRAAELEFPEVKHGHVEMARL